MHKNKMRMIMAAVLVQSLVIVSMPALANDLESQITQAESAGVQIEDQKAQALSQCEELKAELDEINKSIEKYQIQIDYKNEEIDALEENYNRAKRQKRERYELIKGLFIENSDKDKSLDKLFFGIRGNLKFPELPGYTGSLSSSDIDEISSYLDLCEEIRKEENCLKNDRKELEALNKPLNEEKDKLQALVAEKEDLIIYLESQLGAANASLDQLKAQLEAYNTAQAQIEVIRQALALGDGSIRGMFANPCPDGNICSDYGNREDGFHKGIDLKCSTGSPIYAALDGVVTISDYSNTAGNWIVIDHGNGLITKYMHCSERYVSVGDVITQGQHIAAVGCTGSSTTAHLHFQVEFEGSVYSPWEFL